MKKYLISVKNKKTANPVPIVSFVSQPSQEELFTKFTSWNKLQRITAYCLRFLHKCRHLRSRLQGTLSSSELHEATLRCINRAQSHRFKEEKAVLMETGLLSKKNSLLSLNPFIDGNQLIRVGGRLQNSDLTFDQQHPLILPKGHHITSSISEDTHKKNFMQVANYYYLSLDRNF